MNIYTSSDLVSGDDILKYNDCSDEILPESKMIKIWQNA